MGPSFCGGRKSGAFLSSERCVRTSLYMRNVAVRTDRLALIILIVVALRIISEEEAKMLAEFGDEYANYIRQTDSLIPNVW